MILATISKKVTKKTIAASNQSEKMKKAIKLLKYCKSGQITNMFISDYNTAVACFLDRLTQENGARPSTLIGLTLEDSKSSQLIYALNLIVKY